MELWKLVIIGLFLPLFPFSMVFNLLFARLEHLLLRIMLLIAWPLSGLVMIDILEPDIASGAAIVVGWSVLTSALYALRLLVLRELNLWTGFLATSLWALLWIPATQNQGFASLQLDAIGFSAPLVLLVIVGSLLSARFGAAYAGLYNGIARDMPRLSTVLVICILAAIGTPLFPVFFSMLSFMLQTTVLPAIAMLLIWLLWSWAGAMMIQGFAVGETDIAYDGEDISPGLSLALMMALVVLLVSGVSLIGVMA
jgi:hypothetical protein